MTEAPRGQKAGKAGERNLTIKDPFLQIDSSLKAVVLRSDRTPVVRGKRGEAVQARVRACEAQARRTGNGAPGSNLKGAVLRSDLMLAVPGKKGEAVQDLGRTGGYPARFAGKGELIHHRRGGVS